MHRRIAISGKMASGKSTSSTYLIENHGYIRESFGRPVKEFCSEIIELYRIYRERKINVDCDDNESITITNKMPIVELFQQLTKIYARMALLFSGASRDAIVDAIDIVNNQLIPTYSDIDLMADKDDKHRAMLQDIGNLFRRVKSTVWIEYVLDEIDDLPPDACIVIDDIRYQNEYNALKTAGFAMVRINTPQETREQRIQELYGFIDPSRHNHISEVDLDDQEFDFYLDGSKPLDEMLMTLEHYIMGG